MCKRTIFRQIYFGNDCKEVRLHASKWKSTRLKGPSDMCETTCIGNNYHTLCLVNNIPYTIIVSPEGPPSSDGLAPNEYSIKNRRETQACLCFPISDMGSPLWASVRPRLLTVVSLSDVCHIPPTKQNSKQVSKKLWVGDGQGREAQVGQIRRFGKHDQVTNINWRRFLCEGASHENYMVEHIMVLLRNSIRMRRNTS